MAEKVYSVDEANALIPKLKPLLERIRKTQEELAKDKTVAAVREKAAQNGGGLPGRHLSALTKTLDADLRQLAAWGIVLRDPSIGLVDFMHQREGETVCLCWKLGESRVEWWHPLETGIAGRQRL
ncbi:MAG: DUF2203 family protein [Chloroflexota bacterium]|nr:MAG: DUF2203 family protein [Chloroflexota bacterium]TMD87422.1 MAG: DUF2203 family protein [Chloroflexota bacterium]